MNRCIVFTHIKKDMPSPDATWTPDDIHAFQEHHIPSFKAYLKCPNIALVYVYVDMGIRAVMEHLQQNEVPAPDPSSIPLKFPLEEEVGDDLPFKPSKPLKFTLGELTYEQTTRNILKHAVDLAVLRVRQELGETFDRRRTPRFQFIGFPHLTSLIHALYQANPMLVKGLAGRGGALTYDAPKFVEAVIRLVRGGDLQYPILRFDEDVEVNEAGIEALLHQVQEEHAKAQPYAFFSGGYGRANAPEDPVNDHAVRVHWLVDHERYNQGRLKENAEAVAASLSSKGRQFLRDLGEVGATQVKPTQPTSDVMGPWLQTRRRGNSLNREAAQVISGAGLYMSPRAIEALPPFTCFTTFAVWVDDHLKRRLHEVLGHLGGNDPERVPNTHFWQDRHPRGIFQRDLDWASNEYLLRLFRGCLLHALICLPEGGIGPFAKAIKNTLQPKPNPESRADLKQRFSRAAEHAGTGILELWGQADYGSPALREWARAAEPSLPTLVEPLVEDALDYVELVNQWHHYVNVIRELTPAKAHWLFRAW